MLVDAVRYLAGALHYFVRVVVMHEFVFDREPCPRGFESSHELFRVRGRFDAFLPCKFFPSPPDFEVDLFFVAFGHIRENLVLVLL